MSALTDLFTALANKIRSKTGGSATYTPPQMVNAIDDVYQAGVDAGETPTQTKTVTAGTSAVTVTPDTGYALSSVTVNPTPSQSKVTTPTTSAQTVTPNSGYLLSQVDVAPIPSEYKIPIQIMPVNMPGAMTAGEAYSPTQNAYIIDGYTSITPSNTSPAPLYNGMIKSEGTGYAIQSYTSISTAELNSGVYFSSGIKKMASSGYAYSSQQKKCKAGTVTVSTSATTKVTCGFKPGYVAISHENRRTSFYHKDISTTQCRYGSASGYISNTTISTSSTNTLASIDSDGFTIAKVSTAGTCYYFAVEE